ncbi:hypothetical protein NEIELOOT_02720 [Neisseria elongata subsp. glycolytica ATCC 29315]|uniref:Uncharacterized protein n=1 Tax=Neisseria elongata subsp. glycolytica ATCC 29315 TaxID=546263 RepID=D4DUG1_NEIEG|nr:hypothetical protein NEIELOOT_02720 [Neisseria elongata subsp. glycolytica ATCC 29315]
MMTIFLNIFLNSLLSGQAPRRHDAAAGFSGCLQSFAFRLFVCVGVFEAEHLPAAVFPAVVFLVVIHDAAFVFDTDAALADDFDVADDGDAL